MKKKQNYRDLDPIESKRNKKANRINNKHDPLRKNKKYYLQNQNPGD
jgi:hypothetical protein